MRLALPWHSFTSVFFIASITVMGVFNRPTFLAFAFPPIFFWLLRGMGSQIIGKAFLRSLLDTSTPKVCSNGSIMLLIDRYIGFQHENGSFNRQLPARSVWFDFDRLSLLWSPHNERDPIQKRFHLERCRIYALQLHQVLCCFL